MAKYEGQGIGHAYVTLDYQEGPFSLLRAEKIEYAIRCFKESIFYLIQSLSSANLKTLIEETSEKIEEILQENNVAKRDRSSKRKSNLVKPSLKEGKILELIWKQVIVIHNYKALQSFWQILFWFIGIQFLFAIFLSSVFDKDDKTPASNKLIIFDILEKHGTPFMKEVIEQSFRFIRPNYAEYSIEYSLVQTCFQVSIMLTQWFNSDKNNQCTQYLRNYQEIVILALYLF